MIRDFNPYKFKGGHYAWYWYHIRKKQTKWLENRTVYKHEWIYPKENYLKHLRYARYHMKYKHGLDFRDLELLLYLDSEGVFDRSFFELIDNTMAFNKKRMEQLIDKGFVKYFHKSKFDNKHKYVTTHKCHRVVMDFYDILFERCRLSMTERNPVFKKQANFAMKTFRPYVVKYNENFAMKKKEVDEHLKENPDEYKIDEVGFCRACRNKYYKETIGLEQYLDTELFEMIDPDDETENQQHDHKE